MLESFFPKPKQFFFCAVAWALISVFSWYFGGKELGQLFGFDFPADDAPPIIGLGHFTTPDFLWFYIYYFLFTLLFYFFWASYSPHKWQVWSILGSALILFFTYYQVHVSVAVNNWYRPFYDAIQNALSGSSTTTASDLYVYIFSFLILAMTYVLISIATSFFVSHYVFRWRTAMNDFYTARWTLVRHIEGASQRIQEDAMNFAKIVESLGLQVVRAIMLLIAFLPILYGLSANVVIPFFKDITGSLVWVSLIASLGGLLISWIVGIKLPGLEYNNQKVEAAFRKELVYGEDDRKNYVQAPTILQLFTGIKFNYHRLFLHYGYFDLWLIMYNQSMIIVPYLLMCKIASSKFLTDLTETIADKYSFAQSLCEAFFNL